MRKCLLILILLVSFDRTSAQNPVKWKFETVCISDSIQELIITAVIQDGWYIYSKDNGNLGPMPTSVKFDASSEFELMGSQEEEGEKWMKFDPFFNMELAYFKHQLILKQRFKRLTNTDITLKGKVDFMGCDDHMCLPPQSKSFEVPIKRKK
ncbi:MAG TPA: protein-disulfide reductase DsbD domain-containing protein [Parasegetibacter sp.]